MVGTGKRGFAAPCRRETFVDCGGCGSLCCYYTRTWRIVYAKKRGLCRFFLSLAVLVSLFVTPLSASAAYALPDTVALSADAAYVVSLGALQEDDVVLYEKNAETTQQPAASCG